MLAIALLAFLNYRQDAPATSSLPQVAEAQQLSQKGKYEASRDLFERVLSLEPSNPEAQAGVASTSEQISLRERAAGHMDEALAVLLHAKDLLPNDKRILLDLGVLEDEMNLHLDAAATLEHLMTLHPDDPNASYALARVDLNLGRLDAAQLQMNSYLAKRPDDASAHFGMGKIYVQGLHFDQATAEFQRSLALQPVQSEAYYELGQISLVQNHLEEAGAYYRQALARDPKHGGALVGLGTVYFKLKQYSDAKPWLTHAIQVAPGYQPGHYYLGLTLARLGDKEESNRELAVAAALAEKDNQQAATRLRLQNTQGQP